MGIYNVSVNELYDALEETLNNIEGDFTRETLQKALKRLETYEFTID